MSIHISADPGAVAPTVLLPGDPLRAKFVAETYLTDAVPYNEVRGMLGFTGTYNGMPVSVQGSGMGMPTLAIYVQELIREYGVRRIIRIGSAGAMQPDVAVHDIVLAMSASTDSAMNRQRFRGMEFAPVPAWPLLRHAAAACESRGARYHVGGILSSDTFYTDDPDQWRLWAAFGVLAVEMETNQLYTICAGHRVEALSILTISDSLVSEAALSATDRQTSFHTMAQIALEVGTRR